MHISLAGCVAGRRTVIARVRVERVREQVIEAAHDRHGLPGARFARPYGEHCLGGNVAKHVGNLPGHGHRRMAEGDNRAAVIASWPKR
jgi:hypothetical protein